ncbi:MAG: acyl-CoA/acyl-ACP dehydrogenase [Acidimicrobiales bacterium]|nr:acyl-CoA/acyl-ACP dehydrogenase [Acidimicrobiales bacterium]
MDHVRAQLGASVDEVCEMVVRPAAASVDREARHPVESWKALSEIGVLRMRVPVEDGGFGLDLASYIAVIERIARACAASAMTVHMHSTACDAIVRGAPAHRRGEWLAPVVDELTLYGSWGSEPGSSASRLFHSSTTVVRRGDEFVVDGLKHFCTMAGVARGAMVACTLVDEQARHQPVSIFVPGEGPGIEVFGDWEPLGMRGTVSPSVRFSACGIEADRVFIGRSSPGGTAQLALGFSAVMLGSAEGALGTATDHCRAKVLAGSSEPIAADPLVRRHLGHVVARLAAARAVLFEAAREWVPDEPRWSVVPAARAKYVVQDAALAATSELMQIVGGISATPGLGLERAFRDVRTASLMPPNPDRMSWLLGADLLGEQVQMFDFSASQ